ncbi:hypothetical protein TK5_25890 [Sideroxyarcus sp. TK5]
MLFGGEDNDTLRVDVTKGDLNPFNQYGQTRTVYALPEFHADDYLDSGAGEDTLVGDGGNDTLLGGDDINGDILFSQSEFEPANDLIGG